MLAGCLIGITSFAQGSLRGYSYKGHHGKIEQHTYGNRAVIHPSVGGNVTVIISNSNTPRHSASHHQHKGKGHHYPPGQCKRHGAGNGRWK